jgi:transposase
MGRPKRPANLRRGGLTTKIHALVDAEGRPVRLTLTAGQGGDAPAAEDLLDERDPGLRRRPRRLGNIPPRSIRKDAFSFSGWVYRQRNLVERFFNRIKHFRGLATRYDRRPDNFLAALKLAAIRIWLAP